MKTLVALLVCTLAHAADFDDQEPPQLVSFSAFPTSPDEYVFTANVSDLFGVTDNQLQIEDIDIIGSRVSEFTSPCWIHPPKVECWLGLPTDPNFTDVPVLLDSRIVRPRSITGHLMLPTDELGIGWVFTATVTDLDGNETSMSTFFSQISVPEPSGLLLAMLGLAWLPMFRR